MFRKSSSVSKKDLLEEVQRLTGENESLQKKLDASTRRCRDLELSLTRQNEVIAEMTLQMEEKGISVAALRRMPPKRKSSVSSSLTAATSGMTGIPSIFASMSAGARRGSDARRMSSVTDSQSDDELSIGSAVDYRTHDVTHLRAMAKRMMHEVSVKDRKKKLQSFKQCFRADAAVEWLLDNAGISGCENEADAVCIGRALVFHQLIEHVSHGFDEAKFRNGYHLFRFNYDKVATVRVPVRRHSGPRIAADDMQLGARRKGSEGIRHISEAKTLYGPKEMALRRGADDSKDSDSEDGGSRRVKTRSAPRSHRLTDTAGTVVIYSDGDMSDEELPSLRQAEEGSGSRHLGAIHRLSAQEKKVMRDMYGTDADSGIGTMARAYHLASGSAGSGGLSKALLMSAKKHVSLINIELHVSNESEMIDKWDTVESQLMKTPKHKLTLYINDLLVQILQLKNDHSADLASRMRDLGELKTRLKAQATAVAELGQRHSAQLAEAKDLSDQRIHDCESALVQLQTGDSMKQAIIDRMCYRLAVYKDRLAYFELPVFQKWVTLVSPTPQELLRDTAEHDVNPNYFRTICAQLSDAKELFESKKKRKSKRKRKRKKGRSTSPLPVTASASGTPLAGVSAVGSGDISKRETFTMFGLPESGSVEINDYCQMQLVKYPGTRELFFVLKQQLGERSLEFELFRRDYLQCRHVSKIHSRSGAEEISMMFEDTTLVFKTDSFEDAEEVLCRCRELLNQHLMHASVDRRAELEHTIDKHAPVTSALMGLSGAF